MPGIRVTQVSAWDDSVAPSSVLGPPVGAQRVAQTDGHRPAPRARPPTASSVSCRDRCAGGGMTVRNRPYQRRRRGPVLLLVAVLAVVVTVTWTTVLVKTGAATGVAACPPPAAGPVPGEVLAAGALGNVPPVPPSAVKVRVLNASGQRGQANLVAAQLGDFDFAQAAPPTNDPLYPEGDMVCTGQLRFGQAGPGCGEHRRAARAVRRAGARRARRRHGRRRRRHGVQRREPRAGGPGRARPARRRPVRAPPAPATPTPPRATRPPPATPVDRRVHARRSPRGDLPLSRGYYTAPAPCSAASAHSSSAIAGVAA